MPARIRANRHADTGKANPVIESLHKPVTLGHTFQRVEHAAIEHPEVLRVFRDLVAFAKIEQCIKHLRDRALDEGFVVAIRAYRKDHVITPTPLRQKRRNQFGGVLKITIQQHRRVTTRMINAGRQRNLFTKIARELHQLDRQLIDHAHDPFNRGVTAAVVDHEQLMAQPKLHKQGVQRLQHRHNIAFFVERRQQTTNQRIKRPLARTCLQ